MIAPASPTRAGHVSGGPRRLNRDHNGVSSPSGLLRLGAAVGLAMMAATMSGDALAAGVLLGLAAADVTAGAMGVLVAIAIVGRWGSTSLAALAGGQAVVGPAGWSGPVGMVVSSWAGAVAIVAACPRRLSSSPATSQGPSAVAVAGTLACGIFAAALVAGPAVGGETAPVVALRIGASAAGVVAAMLVVRASPRRVARVAGLIAAASAAALAVLA